MGYNRGSVSDLTFSGSHIDIQIETYYCGCCGPDTDYESMPIEYLWDTKWQEEVPKILAKRKEQEKLKAAQQQKREQERIAAAERKKLAELKAKYEEE